MKTDDHTQTGFIRFNGLAYRQFKVEGSGEPIYRRLQRAPDGRVLVSDITGKEFFEEIQQVIMELYDRCGEFEDGAGRFYLV